MDERDEAFEELIERSSLGTPGARQQRRRTPRSQVDAVRRIVDLRNRMFHCATTAAATAGVVAAAGAGPAVVVAATSTVLPVLARVLTTWLRTRRSDVTITLTGPDGRQVSLDAKKANDAENLLRHVLGEQAT